MPTPYPSWVACRFQPPIPMLAHMSGVYLNPVDKCPLPPPSRAHCLELALTHTLSHPMPSQACHLTCTLSCAVSPVPSRAHPCLHPLPCCLTCTVESLLSRAHPCLHPLLPHPAPLHLRCQEPALTCTLSHAVFPVLSRACC